MLLVPWIGTDVIICSLTVAGTQARLQVTLAGGDQARICKHREKPVVLYLTCPSSSNEGPGHWAPGGPKWCLFQEYVLKASFAKNLPKELHTVYQHWAAQEAAWAIYIEPALSSHEKHVRLKGKDGPKDDESYTQQSCFEWKSNFWAQRATASWVGCCKCRFEKGPATTGAQQLCCVLRLSDVYLASTDWSHMPRPDPERFGSLDWGQTNLGQPSQPKASCFESQPFLKAVGQPDREKATKIIGSVAC